MEKEDITMLDYEKLEMKKTEWHKRIKEMHEKIEKCLQETEKILNDTEEKEK